MNPLVIGALALGGVYLIAKRMRRFRGAETVLVPGATTPLPCPSDDELDAYARETGGVAVIVDRRSDVPFDQAAQTMADLARGLNTTVEDLAGRLAYYSRDTCTFYAYQNGQFAEFDLAYDFFFEWRYGPGWKSKLAAADILEPRTR